MKVNLKPKSFHLSMQADGTMNLLVSSAGEYEISFSAQQWEDLARSAQWFNSHYHELLASRTAERDSALARLSVAEKTIKQNAKRK